MNEKETLLAFGGIFVAYLLLRRPARPSSPSTAQLSAQQLAAQQMAAAQPAAQASAASQAGAIAAGIGQGLGSLLQGIGALTGGGSGTNKENGGSYSYESTKVVDEYDALPEYYYDDDSYGVD